MTQLVLGIKASSRCSRKAREEIERLDKEGLWFGWSDVKALQLKGFKYIPMLIHTCHIIRNDEDLREIREASLPMSLFFGYDLPFSYFEETYRLFNSLREKIKVRTRFVRLLRGRGMRALWPCEILDLKEVQDEINRLASQTLLSKEDLLDMEVAKRLFGRPLGKEPTPEDINRIIDGTNWSGKKFGEFFMKALEIRRKYPNARFWFSLEVL